MPDSAARPRQVGFGARLHLFDLVGKQLSPRIRDLGKITLLPDGSQGQLRGTLPHGGAAADKEGHPRPGGGHWDDLLCLAGSLKYGHATASLIVAKVSACSRQNALAAALGTRSTTKYLLDEDYRRKIARS